MNQTEKLNKHIDFMKVRKSKELKVLKVQCRATYESLKPINLLKSACHEFKESPELKNKISESAIGLATGYLAKKVLFRASHNSVRAILSTLLQVAVTNVALKNTDKIISFGTSVFSYVSKIKLKRKAEPGRYDDIY